MRQTPDFNTINVNKAELLAKVTKNRAAHRATFEAALVVYRERALAELETIVDDARNGRKIRRAISLIEPVDYTKEYTRVIAMLNMSLDDFVMISTQDFSRFVLDDWEWKEHFRMSTSDYLVDR